MNANQSPDCAQAISQLFGSHSLHPVVIDIGASGPPRKTWESIAAHSIFVGFDPDLREIRELTGTGFFRAVMVNDAVTAEKGTKEVTFFLTRSPYCSSTLEPDLKALSDYSFADLFQVERTVKVKATTLDVVLERLELDRIHWFKTDSQGTDLALFNSLPQPVRESVLCVELEPGLIDAYKGEDFFIDAHRDLIGQGFWLSEANVCGTARIRQTTIQRLRQLKPEVDAETVRTRSRVTPGWVEATYLRSIDQLVGRGAPASDYILLWAFALVGRQWGFALDVAFAYESLFGADENSKMMITPLTEWFTRFASGPPVNPVRGIKSLIPVEVKQWIKDRMR